MKDDFQFCLCGSRWRRGARGCAPQYCPKGLQSPSHLHQQSLQQLGEHWTSVLCATGQAVVTLTLGLFFVLVWLVGFLGGFVGFCFFFFNSFLFGYEQLQSPVDNRYYWSPCNKVPEGKQTNKKPNKITITNSLFNNLNPLPWLPGMDTICHSFSGQSRALQKVQAFGTTKNFGDADNLCQEVWKTAPSYSTQDHEHLPLPCHRFQGKSNKAFSRTN